MAVEREGGWTRVKETERDREDRDKKQKEGMRDKKYGMREKEGGGEIERDNVTEYYDRYDVYRIDTQIWLRKG